MSKAELGWTGLGRVEQVNFHFLFCVVAKKMNVLLATAAAAAAALILLRLAQEPKDFSCSFVDLVALVKKMKTIGSLMKRNTVL